MADGDAKESVFSLGSEAGSHGLWFGPVAEVPGDLEAVVSVWWEEASGVLSSDADAHVDVFTNVYPHGNGRSVDGDGEPRIGRGFADEGEATVDNLQF